MCMLCRSHSSPRINVGLLLEPDHSQIDWTRFTPNGPVAHQRPGTKRCNRSVYLCTSQAGLGLKTELPQIPSAGELVKLGVRPQLAEIRYSYCADGCFLRELSGDCQFAMLASRFSAHLTAGTSRLHEQPMASTSSLTSFASPLYRQQLTQSNVGKLERMTRHQRYGSCRPLSISDSQL